MFRLLDKAENLMLFEKKYEDTEHDEKGEYSHPETEQIIFILP